MTRRRYVMATAFVAAAFGVSFVAIAIADPLPRVIWNASASDRERDGRGRPLPVWQDCRTLGADELLLLNPDHPDSLDGRYFGPLPTSTVIGRATPLHLRAPAAPPSPPSKKEIGHADQYL